MIYDLHQKLILSQGAMPARNYYIPFTKPEANAEKTKSELLKSVYEWKISKVKKFSQAIFSQKAKFKRTLPIACKQLCEIDNGRDFPFEYTPPEISGDIYAVVYESKVRYNSLHDKYYLVFESVSACFYLFFNGEFVGYSANGQTTTEFDVTPYMKLTNEIKVVVLNRCSLSYISAIKPMRPFGITGDVYILNRQAGHIFDYGITSSFEGGSASICFDGDAEAEVSLFEEKREIAKQKGKHIEFVIDKPKLWSSERPFLYRAVVHSANEYIEERIGIISVLAEGKDLLINGSKAFLKGVKRSPFTAYGCFENDKILCEDIIKMKRCGINAVYCPYYPANPEFARLCDKFGLYVIESAEVNYSNGETLTRSKSCGVKLLRESELFKQAVKERIKLTCVRDKNRPSVIMWAVGGQTGRGEEEAFCDETALTSDIVEKGDFLTADFDDDIAEMPEEELRTDAEIISGEDIDKSRPFLLFYCDDENCDGTRNFSEVVGAPSFLYQSTTKPTLIVSDDNCIIESDCLTGEGITGVFPCEFTYLKFKGKTIYGLYSRDKKECSSLIKNLSNDYFPIDVLREDDSFIIKNNCIFSEGNSFSGKCFIKADNKVVDSFNLGISKIKSGESKKFAVDTSKYSGNFVCADFVFHDLSSGASTVKQFVLSDSFVTYTSLPYNGVHLYGNVMGCKKYSVKFSESGMISSIISGRKKFVVGDISFCADRAALSLQEEYANRTDKLSQVKFIQKDFKSEGNKVVVKGILSRPNMAEIMDIDMEYSFFDDGTILIKFNCKMPEYIDGLYRFGLVFPVSTKFKKVSYFGMGKDECYYGEEGGAHVEEYECDIGCLREKLPLFKESGSRREVKHFTLFHKKMKMRFSADVPLSFSIKKGKIKNRSKCLFKRTESVHLLHVDYQMSGRMGENVEKGKLTNKDFGFCLTIKV